MRLLYIADNGFSKQGEDFYYGGASENHSGGFYHYFDELVFVARKDKPDASARKVNGEVYLFSKYNIFGTMKKIKELLPTVDAILINGLNGCFAAIPAKKRNVKVIAYNGGDSYDFLLSQHDLKGRILAPIARYMERHKFKHADYAHYCTEFLVNRLPSDGKKLICSGVCIVCDETVLSKRIHKIETSDEQQDKITIGLIGHLKNGLKGIDIAIQAMAHLDERYVLQIVGRGGHEAYDLLAEKLGVSTQVQFLGPKKSGSDIMEWLDEVDVYIQPSRVEGLPRATIEAMSRGCPVVSSDAGALMDLIDKDFVVKKEDAGALAAKIMQISSQCDTMKKQGTRNFEKAKQYEEKVKKEKYDTFYNQVIAEIEQGKNSLRK